MQDCILKSQNKIMMEDEGFLYNNQCEILKIDHSKYTLFQICKEFSLSIMKCLFLIARTHPA